MKKGMLYLVIKNRTVTIFILVLIFIYGLYSYIVMPRQEIPDISSPVARVTAIYPGASPENVEKLVTSKLEDAVSEIPDYDYIQSYSKDSVSIIIVFLANEANVEKSWDELRRKVGDVKTTLPEQCGEIKVETDLVDTAGMIISLSGDNYSYEDLVAYAQNFKKDLNQINGVARFDITGELKTGDCDCKY